MILKYNDIYIMKAERFTTCMKWIIYLMQKEFEPRLFTIDDQDLNIVLGKKLNEIKW